MKKIAGILCLAVSLIACNQEPVSHASPEGTWTCEEQSTLGTKTFLIEIDPRTVESDMWVISNFHNVGDSYFAKVSLTDLKFTFVQNQQIGGVTIRSGSGTMNEDYTRIVFSYKLYEGGDMLVEAICTRR